MQGCSPCTMPRRSLTSTRRRQREGGGLRRQQGGDMRRQRGGGRRQWSGGREGLMEGRRKGEVLNRLKRKEVYVGVFSIAEFRLNMHVSMLISMWPRFSGNPGPGNWSCLSTTRLHYRSSNWPLPRQPPMTCAHCQRRWARFFYFTLNIIHNIIIICISKISLK